MDIVGVLDKYFYERKNIDVSKDYPVEYVEAKELIVATRIDLVAKIKYVEYKEKGYDLTFIKKMYQAHIEAFSLGRYIEPGSEEKNSITKYFDVFDSLIENIKKNGVDEKISVIPVGSDNSILNGAHRIATAAYFGLTVPIIRFDHLSANFGPEFFKKRLLATKYLDYLVNEFCKINLNVALLIVPKSCLKDEFPLIISKNIFYTKEISLDMKFFNKKTKHFVDEFSDVNEYLVKTFEKNFYTKIKCIAYFIDETIDIENCLKKYLQEEFEKDTFLLVEKNNQMLSLAYFLLNRKNNRNSLKSVINDGYIAVKRIKRNSIYKLKKLYKTFFQR